MRWIHTDGVYHPYEATVDDTAVCTEAGKIVGVRDRVPARCRGALRGKGVCDPRIRRHPLTRPNSLRWGDLLGQMRADPSIQAIRAANNLRRDLRAGTTTIRLLGCEHRLDLRLRESGRAGELEALFG